MREREDVKKDIEAGVNGFALLAELLLDIRDELHLLNEGIFTSNTLATQTHFHLQTLGTVGDSSNLIAQRTLILWQSLEARMATAIPSIFDFAQVKPLQPLEPAAPGASTEAPEGSAP